MSGFDYICDGQMTIYDWINGEKPRLRLDRKIRLIEAFAGIGSQLMSLRDLGVDLDNGRGGYGAYRVIEFDKYACVSYNAIHNDNIVPTDIRDIHGCDLGIVEREKYQYIFFYSFPCTDLSCAGTMSGYSYEDWENGNATRSGLLWEVKRLLDETEELPQILICENVPQVHSKANEKDWNRWMQYLFSRGYTTKWCDMNSRDFGIPQSRNRTFAISWLGNYSYEFPEIMPLEKTMEDYLEECVDVKYCIHSEKAHILLDELFASGKLPQKKKRISVNVENCGTSDEKKTPTIRENGIAVEMCSRDAKGLKNCGDNAVVQIEMLDKGFEDSDILTEQSRAEQSRAEQSRAIWMRWNNPKS